MEGLEVREFCGEGLQCCLEGSVLGGECGQGGGRLRDLLVEGLCYLVGEVCEQGFLLGIHGDGWDGDIRVFGNGIGGVGCWEGDVEG